MSLKVQMNISKCLITLPSQFEGRPYSSDTQINSIAKYNYLKVEPQHLDYILLYRDHAQLS